MLSPSTINNIKKTIPDIVERARLGDQNALAMLVEIKRKKGLNPRSSFSYEVACKYAKEHPVNSSFNGDETDSIYEIIPQLSPLACAILIVPNIDSFDFSKVKNNIDAILGYIISLISIRNGDFCKFPLIESES